MQNFPKPIIYNSDFNNVEQSNRKVKNSKKKQKFRKKLERMKDVANVKSRKIGYERFMIQKKQV
jgi:hypothetical protein